jgi:hypothetical protein
MLIYTLATLSIALRKPSPVRVYRHFFLAALCLSAAALADEAGDDSAAAVDNNWLGTTVAQCEQEFDKDRCADPQFLEEHYHVESLQVAHKAAQRHSKEEKRATRELLLQRLCTKDLKKYCAAEGSVNCLPRTQQLCASIVSEAAQCIGQAKQYCAENPQESNCLANMTAHCPVVKKQTIAVFLARYPKLTDPQRVQLAQMAQQLDNNTRSFIGSLFKWLGLGG